MDEVRLSMFPKEEFFIWHMMKNGLNEEPVEVSYAADVVFVDENTDKNMFINNSKRKKSMVYYVLAAMLVIFLHQNQFR